MIGRRRFLGAALAFLAAPVTALVNGYVGPWTIPEASAVDVLPGAAERLGWIDAALAELWDANALQPTTIWVSREAFESIRGFHAARAGPVEPFRFDDFRRSWGAKDREAVKAWAATTGRPLGKLVEAERRLA